MNVLPGKLQDGSAVHRLERLCWSFGLKNSHKIVSFGSEVKLSGRSFWHPVIQRDPQVGSPHAHNPTLVGSKGHIWEHCKGFKPHLLGQLPTCPRPSTCHCPSLSSSPRPPDPAERFLGSVLLQCLGWCSTVARPALCYNVLI